LFVVCVVVLGVCRYHRILKKQKQKSAMSLDELGQLDEETARTEAEKIERLRIQERITQRCVVACMRFHLAQPDSHNFLCAAR